MHEKIYEATHEVSGDQMSEHDKQVNLHLAAALFNNHISKVKCGVEDGLYYHMDIGSKYPYFGKCLHDVTKNRCAIIGNPCKIIGTW